MTQRLFVAVLTVVVFLAGYGVRAWTAPRETVPPPPAALAQAYAPAAAPASGEKGKRALDRAKLVAEINKLRPQVEAYCTHTQEIEAEFDRGFNAILNAKQLEKRNAYLKRRAAEDAKRSVDRTPLSDEAIARMKERSLSEIYWLVTVTPRLERLTKEYDLDARQQTDTRALLTLRRNQYIALFDATPHPSVRMSRLVPLIERVAEAPKPAK
jgi:hypothetical protein